ncbi:hypothetical protein D3C78_1818130 [compost metagenome]
MATINVEFRAVFSRRYKVLIVAGQIDALLAAGAHKIGVELNVVLGYSRSGECKQDGGGQRRQ